MMNEKDFFDQMTTKRVNFDISQKNNKDNEKLCKWWRAKTCFTCKHKAVFETFETIKCELGIEHSYIASMTSCCEDFEPMSNLRDLQSLLKEDYKEKNMEKHNWTY